MNLYSSDGDEVMKQGDEVFNTYHFMFSEALNASLL
jgi:hypothetical protein